MIGIFDSGSGGLTVLRAIRERLPSTDIVYFGDIKNAPYGSKSQKELSQLTVSAMQLLKGHGATSIVSACNSVSASLAISLFDAFSIAPDRLVEMVGPTVSSLKDSPAKLMLVATPATIHSGIYQNAFHMVNKDIETVSIPDLAGLIELGGTAEDIERVIRSALPATITQVDVVILACTHYPLVLDVFRRIFDSRMEIIDPAFAVAQRVEKQLWPRETGEGKTTFLITKDSPTFRTFVDRFFGGSHYEVKVLS